MHKTHFQALYEPWDVQRCQSVGLCCKYACTGEPGAQEALRDAEGELCLPSAVG